MKSRVTRVTGPRVALSLLAIGLGTLWGAGGCGSKSSFRGTPPSPEDRRKAFPTVHEDYAKLGYRQDWIGYPVLSGRAPILYFQPYADCVVALEAGSRVTVLETSNGAYRGSNQLSSRLTKFVGLGRDGNRIYVSSEADVFILDVATAGLLDRQPYENIVATAPVQIGNQLIYGTGSGEIMAHLASNAVHGVKTWGFAVPGAIEHNPVRVGGAIGAVSQLGEVVFVSVADGSLVGRNHIFKGLDTNPVAGDDIMYVASLDQSIYAFAAAGGRQVWRHRTAAPLREQPTLVGNQLLCTIPGEGLTALDARTGAIQWQAAGVTGTVIGVRKGHLLVWNGTEAVLVDPPSGDVFDRVELPGVRMLRLDKFEDGNLYVVSKSGVIAKFVTTR